MYLVASLIWQKLRHTLIFEPMALPAKQLNFITEIIMQNSASLVIIGSGIVGCSAAYHLSKLGWKDILVIDQGELFHTGGSTSHAPGTLFQLNPSKMMTKLSKYTHDLYDSFSIDGVKAVERLGSLQLAHNPERWKELKRLHSISKSWDLETELLSAEETLRKLPILSSDKLIGSLSTPSDATGRAVIAAESMARKAIETGAVKFQGKTRVSGFDIRNGVVRGVITEQGNISCEKALVCGGIWGPSLGEMIGMNIPLQPLEHLYLKTNPLEELKEHSENGSLELKLPSLRAQDYGCYYRQHFDCWGIGIYNHKPLSLKSQDIRRHEDSVEMPSINPFTSNHLSAGENASQKLFPCIKEAGYSYKINGIFSFLPDGFPLMGEFPKVKGIWLCEAIWIMHSGGAGKAIAEWMTEGSPAEDLHEADINRFYEFQTRKEYVRVTSEQSYREVHDIIHPHQPMTDPINLRRSPFYQAMKSKGAVFFYAGGWARPQWFESNSELPYKNPLPSRNGWEAQYWSEIQAKEHLAVRQNAGLFDITAFAKFEIKGKDALTYLQKICVNQLDVPVGNIVYTALVNNKGMIECDLTITRREEETFLVVTGAGSGPRDLTWLRKHLSGERLSIIDLTSTYAGLGLWGPNSRKILEPITDESLTNEDFPFYTARTITINHVPVTALRISYIGELGWELYCPTEFGEHLYETICHEGEKQSMIQAGNGVYDSMRMEKGFRSLGSDLNADYNPYEAGLGWTVNYDKAADFIGKKSLSAIKESGTKKKLSTLVLKNNDVFILGKEPIFHGNKKIGYVTSTNTGYSVGKHILFSYLPIEFSKIGTELEVEYFEQRHKVEVTSQVLFDKKNTRMKA